MMTWYWFCGGIDRRYLALAEGVVERIVDLADRQPEPRRGGAVDDQIGFQPLLLLVEIDVGQLRQLLQRGFDLGRPVVDLLRGRRPAACTGIRRCWPARRPGCLSPAARTAARRRPALSFGRSRSMICCADTLRSDKRLQDDKDKPGIGLAAAGKPVDRCATAGSCRRMSTNWVSFCCIDWNEMLWSAWMPPITSAVVLLRDKALSARS